MAAPGLPRRRLLPAVAVGDLIIGQGVDLDPQRAKLKGRYVAIDLGWHPVDLGGHLAGVTHEVLGGKCLGGEEEIHYRRWMTLCCGKVN